MPPPTEAREGCSGHVGDACTHQLDGVDDNRRPPSLLSIVCTMMTPRRVRLPTVVDTEIGARLYGDMCTIGSWVHVARGDG